jgi:hypothetical protein
MQQQNDVSSSQQAGNLRCIVQVWFYIGYKYTSCYAYRSNQMYGKPFCCGIRINAINTYKHATIIHSKNACDAIFLVFRDTSK